MAQENKWGVVVGQPNMKLWKNDKGKPDLSNVGLTVAWGDSFRTRRAARIQAKKLQQGNPWWRYHAKKMDS